MLIRCPTCDTDISDQALSCPRCGHPLVPAVRAALAGGAPPARVRRAPAFLIVAGAAMFLEILTPRLLLIFPTGLVLVAAVVALIRRERAAWAGIGFSICAVALLLIGSAEMAAPVGAYGTRAEDLSQAEIKDWSWHAAPDFGTRGAVKWHVRVANHAARNMASVEVEITTFDASGKSIASSTTYVQAILAGGEGSADSYADYYGTEAKAGVRIVHIRYAD